MAAGRGESKAVREVESDSSRLADAVSYESKEDPKIALKTALTKTYPDMPESLCGVISHYLLPNNIKKRMNDWKERKLEPAVLGRELLEAFSYPDSNVAIALNDLTEDERTSLLTSPDFPELLKLYYLPGTEFKRVIDTQPYKKIQSALLFGLDTEEQNLIRLDEATHYFMRSLMHPIKEDKVQLLASEAEFKRLCHDNPLELIHTIKIKYACSHLGSRNGLDGLAALLIKRSSLHVSLSDTSLQYFCIDDVNLSGANLRGSILPQNGKNLKLCGADLRNAQLCSSFSSSHPGMGFDLRGANLTGIKGNTSKKLCSYVDPINRVDFLGAILDEENKKSICEKLNFTDTRAIFKPMADYFNKKYNTSQSFFKTHPSWDLCVHVLRITRATNALEFAELRREIPEELTKKGRFIANPFNEALQKVSENFLQSELAIVPAKRLDSSR